MRYVFTAVKAALLVCIVLFSIFNRGNVELVLIPGKAVYNMPLFLPILCGILVGVLITVLLLMGERFKLSKELKKARKDLTNVQDEVQRLHNLPLMDKDEK